MSEPIRSASASPFAAFRPQVQSRRVSLRIGSFGLTYSTDRVLWNPDAPAVDPVPALESEQQSAQQAAEHAASQAAQNSTPQDLEAARQQALWRAAQLQAAQQFAAQQQAQAQRQKAHVAANPERTARSPDQAEATSALDQGAQAAGQGSRTGPVNSERTLRQAMRQATKAYLDCARNFACPRPMLQAVA